MKSDVSTEEVLAYVKAKGDVTQAMVENHFKIPPGVAYNRLFKLKNKGRIRVSRETRPGMTHQREHRFYSTLDTPAPQHLDRVSQAISLMEEALKILKQQRGDPPTIAEAVRRGVAAGKSNEEIWEEIQPMFGLPDDKRWYPGWYRAAERRKAA